MIELNLTQYKHDEDLGLRNSKYKIISKKKINDIIGTKYYLSIRKQKK